MTDTATASWPAMTVEEAHAFLTAPETPFEMETVPINGVATRVYKSAPKNLAEVFEAASAWNDRDFIAYEGERLTYLEHRLAVLKLAKELQERYDIKKGDRIALAMRNYPEWPIIFWATVLVGGVIVPLNAWGTGPELEYGIKDSGATLAFLDAQRLERLRPHLNDLSLKAVVAVRTPQESAQSCDLFEDIVAPPSSYKGLEDRPIPTVNIEPDDNATIFYTSGTTGHPKGALGTHRNVLTNLLSSLFTRARAMMRRGEMPEMDPNAPQSSSLISVPLFHATGCHSIMVPTVATGGKLVMMHRWDPETALQLIEKEKVRSFGGVPAMVWQVLESPEFDKYDLSSVEAIGYGGAPSAPDLVKRIKQAFPDVAPSNGYGLTETSAITTMNLGEDYVNRPDSAGVPVAVCDVKIVDDQGGELPQGEIGEIWIKGPNVVKGYWNKPEATAETFSEGWLHSGDLGRIDEEGFVYILDRAKDMLIRGGENIYCVEVEDALYAHASIMDAAVVGIPDHVLGEEVGAVVQVAPGKGVTAEELKAHVGRMLANFKVPVEIEFRNEPLPRNANGKILKRQIRDEFLKHLGKDSSSPI